MPINKNQMVRLQEILKILRTSDCLNSTTFELRMRNNYDPAFNISAKTFSRDIAFLKEELHAPIEYSYKKRGFYLSDFDWYDQYMLTAAPGDMKALLLGGHVANYFLPPQLRNELNNAVRSLLMKNDTGVTAGMNLDNFQIISPEFTPQVDPQVFLEVYKAWEQKNYLKISYCSSKKHRSDKLIEPHILAWNSGIWYIKGYVVNSDGKPCDPPFDIRVFALHRISKAQKTEGFFSVSPEDISLIKKSGLFDFQTLEEVEIEFFQPYVQQTAERFNNRPEAIIAQSDESIRIRLTDIPEYAALQLIFTAMGYVRVIKPASLQESLRNAAQRILENISRS